MNWKYITALILIIILIIYILFYPLQFEFYESLKAKKIADYIVIPIFMLIIMYDLFQNIKKGEKEWKKYALHLTKGVALFLVCYVLILRSFFSSGIIAVNSIFGEKETIKIKGIITHKTALEGSGKFTGKYELIINQNGNEFVFESNHKAINNYKVKDHFEMEMKKGIVNLLYK